MLSHSFTYTSAFSLACWLSTTHPFVCPRSSPHFFPFKSPFPLHCLAFSAIIFARLQHKIYSFYTFFSISLLSKAGAGGHYDVVMHNFIRMITKERGKRKKLFFRASSFSSSVFTCFFLFTFLRLWLFILFYAFIIAGTHTLSSLQNEYELWWITGNREGQIVIVNDIDTKVLRCASAQAKCFSYVTQPNVSVFALQ